MAQKSVIGQRNWDIVNLFQGYRNREDPTNLEPGIMVYPSRNVLTNLSDRIGPRGGYTLFGQDYSGNMNPVLGSFDLLDIPTSIPERHLKTWGTNIECLWEGFDDTSPAVWNNIFSTATSAYWNFTQFWEGDIQKQWILGVNGGNFIWAWNTALAGFLSTTANTVTKQGSTTWEEEGFDPYANYTASIQFLSNNTTTGIISNLDTTPTTGGSGYVAGDVLTLTGANGTGATAEVVTISTNGGVLSVILIGGGSNYIVTSNVTTTGGTGSGCTLNILAIQSQTTGAQMIDATGGFLTENFQIGQSIVITGTTSNDGTYIIADITSTTITVAATQNFTAETDAATTIVYTPSFTVNGIAYTYTGGLSSTTLTGVSGPVVASVGDMIFQTPVTYDLTLMYGMGLTMASVLTTDASQLYIGGPMSSIGYVSNIDTFFDYTFSLTGRLAGTGAQLNFDGTPTSMANLDGNIIISTGQNEWNLVEFNTSQTSIDGQPVSIQEVNLSKIKTTALQGAISQGSLVAIENNLAFLSFSNQLLLLGKTQFQDGQQTTFYDNDVMTELSAPVVYDFNSLDFTDATTFYADGDKYLLCSFPRSGIVMIFNLNTDQQYWECPQELNIGRFAIIHGKLYGHGYLLPETYEMFTTNTDNGGAINSLAIFSYQQFGYRVNLKHGYGTFVEGYIQANTIVTFGWQYEQLGCGNMIVDSFVGSDAQFVCLAGNHNLLGKQGLGKYGLGTITTQNIGNQDLPPAFNIISTVGTPIDFRQAQFFIGSNGIDEYWQLISYGMEVTVSDKINVAITR